MLIHLRSSAVLSLTPKDWLAHCVVPTRFIVSQAHHIFCEHFAPREKVFICHFYFSLFFVYFCDKGQNMSIQQEEKLLKIAKRSFALKSLFWHFWHDASLRISQFPKDEHFWHLILRFSLLIGIILSLTSGKRASFLFSGPSTASIASWSPWKTWKNSTSSSQSTSKMTVRAKWQFKNLSHS